MKSLAPSDEKELLDSREALVEMYKAGFLDAFSLTNKMKKKADWTALNEAYRDAFIKRFEKKVKKELRKK